MSPPPPLLVPILCPSPLTRAKLGLSHLSDGPRPCSHSWAWLGQLPSLLPWSPVAHPKTRLFFQNHSNSDVVSINCNVRLAPNQEVNFHLLGNLWLRSLKAVSRAPELDPNEAREGGGCRGISPQGKGWLLTRPLIIQLKYKLMKITVNAALQRQFHSPFIFREEDPSRQVSPPEPCRPQPESDQLGKGLPLSLELPMLCAHVFLQERGGPICSSEDKREARQTGCWGMSRDGAKNRH